MMKMKRLLILLLSGCILSFVSGQDIPQHISYYRIYEFMDELANDGFFELNSAVKPYSGKMISDNLQKAKRLHDSGGKLKLNSRQLREVKFFLNQFALENDSLPKTSLNIVKNDKTRAAFWAPGIFYRDSNFRASITPILGMHLSVNDSGTVDKKWYGAEFQGVIGKNLAIYGSLRDISHWTTHAFSGKTYLNNYPGYEYTFGKDFSDSRGGITYANQYFSVGLKKDNIVWGDNQNGANILSGRAPSIPMLYFRFSPANWFELNYFHGWLVSNLLDSTSYYIENGERLFYRPANKFMAANMFTFTPFKKFKISVGNSIVYAERNIQAGYLLPIAFYKSIDHMLTKGTSTENQNSQLFFNISSRNIKHLHLYGSAFLDELQITRFLPSSPDKNPMSLKGGVSLTNFPIPNVSFFGEYTKTNIINYKHSIPNLTYASNGYNLGHYLGDNATEMYFGVKMKLFRGFDVSYSYVDAKHGKEYNYVRRDKNLGLDIEDIISYPTPGEIIWSNQTSALKITWEIFSRGYAILNYENSNIQGYDLSSPVDFGETRMASQQVLDLYTPKILQGKQSTLTMGFSFGF